MTASQNQQNQEQAEPVRNGEQAMWRAVIDRALDDACGHCGGEGRYSQRERIIENAVAWFDRTGIDMRMVCDLADLNSEAVSIRAAAEIRRTALEPPTLQRQKTVRHVRAKTVGPAAR